MLVHLLIWGIGLLFILTLATHLPNLVYLVTRHIFGVSRNTAKLFQFALLVAILVFGLRSLLPLAGFQDTAFTVVWAFFNGSFVYAFSDFFKNTIAWLFILISEELQPGDKFKHSDKWYIVRDIRPQFIILHSEQDPTSEVRMPISFFLSNMTEKRIP